MENRENLFDMYVKCATIEEWIKLSVQEKLKFIRLNNYREVISTYEETDVKAYNAEKEFEKAAAFIGGFNYSNFYFKYAYDDEGEIHFCTNDFSDRKYPMENQAKAIFDLYVSELMPMHTDEHHSSFALQQLGLIKNGVIFDWGTTKYLGIREHMIGSGLFPFADGISRASAPSIFNDLIHEKVLFLVPKKYLTDIKDVTDHINQYLHDQVEIGLDSTILYYNAIAKEGAELRKQLTSENAHWENWNSVLTHKFAPELSASYWDDFVKHRKPKSALVHRTPDEHLLEELSTMPIEQKIKLFKEKIISWKDFYPENNKQVDTLNFAGTPITADNKIDDNFRRTAYKEYPIMNLGWETNYWTFFNQIDSLSHEYRNDLTIENFTKQAEKIIATDYWIAGLTGLRKFTDIAGGEKKFPKVYTEPSEYKKIPKRPDTLFIKDTNDNITKAEDLDEFQWYKQYNQTIKNMQERDKRPNLYN